MKRFGFYNKTLCKINQCQRSHVVKVYISIVKEVVELPLKKAIYLKAFPYFTSEQS